MNILQLAQCAMGKHKRDRHHVRRDDYDYHSKCIGCGRPMIRGATGWHLAEKDDAPPPPSAKKSAKPASPPPSPPPAG